MSNWKSVLRGDLILWLLEPANPSVRYFTLTDLSDYPQDDPRSWRQKEPSRHLRRMGHE